METINNISSEMQRRRHQPVPPAPLLVGTVTRIGYYGDTLPKLIITVKKGEVAGIPFREGERISLPFVIRGQTYTAGVRTTQRSTTVMVCPDLSDAAGSPARLTDVLFSQGITQTRLALLIDNGAIYCCLNGEGRERE
jgi:hypothetical protein